MSRKRLEQKIVSAFNAYLTRYPSLWRIPGNLSTLKNLKMSERIRTKRGNISSDLKTKSMSRLFIGLQKVALDQDAKPYAVSISQQMNGEMWYREVKNKPSSRCDGLMTAMRFARPYLLGGRMFFKPVVVTHYVLSSMGKKKLERLKLAKNGKNASNVT